MSKGRKFTLVWLHPRERLITDWVDLLDGRFRRSVDHYVNRVMENKVDLTLAEDSNLIQGQYYFDELTKELYIFPQNNPLQSYIVSEYRLHFSNRPINLPWNLEDGFKEVEYLPLLKSGGKWSEEIDEVTAIGKVKAASGNIKIKNTDGFFVDIFDKYVFEQTRVDVFGWYDDFEFEKIRKKSSSIITDKSYSNDSVTFKLKSSVEKLLTEMKLERYSLSDGNIPNSLTGRVKRTVFGKVDNLHLYSMDQVGESYSLTGSFTGITGTNRFDGVGAELLGCLYPEDTVVYKTVSKDYEFVIDKVYDDYFTVVDELEESFNNISFEVEPFRAINKKNRIFHIAGHELKEFEATITGMRSFNRFYVDSIKNFKVDDFVYINGDRLKIRSVSATEIVTSTNVNQLPNIGDKIIKYPVFAATIRNKNLVVERDYTVENNGDAKLIISEEAELNVAPSRSVTATSLTFTDASRDVVGVDSKFTDEIRPSDWIRPVGKAYYVQVLQVIDDNNLQLVEAYNQGTVTSTATIKSPEYIEDDTSITCSCYGATFDELKNGEFIETASDVVKYLCLKAGISEEELDLDSFEYSKKYTPYTVSLPVPRNRSEEPPKYSEVINQLNESVLGSLYFNTNAKLSYNALVPEIKNEVLICRDSDRLSHKIDSAGRDVAKETIVNYSFQQYDPTTDEDGGKSLNKTNEFVANVTDIETVKSYDLAIYEDYEAQLILERLSFLRETPSLSLDIKSKDFFFESKIGDVVICAFNDMFKRIGQKSIIGMITKIEDLDDQFNVTVSDLSGWFNKVAKYADDGEPIYINSTDEQKKINGFYNEDTGLIDDQSSSYRRNLYI